MDNPKFFYTFALQLSNVCNMRLVYIVSAMYYPNGMAKILTDKMNWLAEHTNYEIWMIETERADLPHYYSLNPKIKFVNFDLNFDAIYSLSFIKRILAYKYKERKFEELLTNFLIRNKPDITISTLRREINFLHKINDMNSNITLHNGDCVEYMKAMDKKSVDLLLTDIPYNEVNRKDNGLRSLDKGVADSAEFDLDETLKQFMRVTKGSIYVFCGIEQVSHIKKTFRENGLSTRLVVWNKTNPSPMNGDKIWLSSVECCVYGKFPKATFNEHCKGSVLNFPSGRSKIHRMGGTPTKASP